MARSNDISRLKGRTATLASKTGRPLALISETKSDRGFNNDATGRMLIPIRYLKAYDRDPVGYDFYHPTVQIFTRPQSQG